jgi:hypothetical protein
MPRRQALRLTEFTFFDPHGAVAVKKMVNALCDVNAVHSKTKAKKDIEERILAFFKPHKVNVTTHGSVPTEMALPGSDMDFIFIFPMQPKEDVVALLHQFAAETEAVIDHSVKTPGNLVRFTIGDEQLDIFCVWEESNMEFVDSLNGYMQDCQMMVLKNVPISIRDECSSVPFIPDLYACLVRIMAEVKQSDHTYGAFLLTKLVVETSLSSVAIACLVIMSEYETRSPFRVMQKMLINMKAIDEVLRNQFPFSPETIRAIQKMGTHHFENGGIFIMADYQLIQIQKAIPSFTQFLRATSLIDAAGDPIRIGDHHPISPKLQAICNKLADLFVDPDTADFKNRARAIARAYN